MHAQGYKAAMCVTASVRRPATALYSMYNVHRIRRRRRLACAHTRLRTTSRGAAPESSGSAGAAVACGESFFDVGGTRRADTRSSAVPAVKGSCKSRPAGSLDPSLPLPPTETLLPRLLLFRTARRRQTSATCTSPADHGRRRRRTPHRPPPKTISRAPTRSPVDQYGVADAVSRGCAAAVV